jgi:hypothetical protein
VRRSVEVIGHDLEQGDNGRVRGVAPSERGVEHDGARVDADDRPDLACRALAERDAPPGGDVRRRRETESRSPGRCRGRETQRPVGGNDPELSGRRLRRLEEAEADLGIADWIDPETGEPAEESIPRVGDDR